MHDSGFPWLGFIFWLGLFSWFGIKAWSRYLAELERQKTLRIFAERGAPLDKELMEQLSPTRAWPQPPAPWQPSRGAGSRALALAGIVVMFGGAGLLIGAQLIANIAREALFGMSTAGVIVLCIGLGLVTASWALRRMKAQDEDRISGASDNGR